mmetsp:Transcript_37414/g.65822  ORF Transcript_37414/g.65822 Transcript_37414/m.65822 type:complete len:117 (+) Transcript_37414:125-475(+)
MLGVSAVVMAEQLQILSAREKWEKYGFAKITLMLLGRANLCRFDHRHKLCRFGQIHDYRKEILRLTRSRCPRDQNAMKLACILSMQKTRRYQVRLSAARQPWNCKHFSGQVSAEAF